MYLVRKGGLTSDFVFSFLFNLQKGVSIFSISTTTQDSDLAILKIKAKLKNILRLSHFKNKIIPSFDLEGEEKKVHW